MHNHLTTYIHPLSLQLNNITHSSTNWKQTYITVGLSILWFIGVVLVNGFDEASTRANIRWSARFSLICFCLAFGASSMYSLVQNSFTRWLLQNRKYLGVSFAIIHLIHLMFLVLLHSNFYQVFVHRSMIELTLGGLAYVFIVLMLLTSFKVFSTLISKSVWNTLHTIGGYWILIVFSNSMIGRMIGGKYEYLPFVILLAAVWLVRLIAIVKRKTAMNSVS